MSEGINSCSLWAFVDGLTVKIVLPGLEDDVRVNEAFHEDVSISFEAAFDLVHWRITRGWQKLANLGLC